MDEVLQGLRIISKFCHYYQVNLRELINFSFPWKYRSSVFIVNFEHISHLYQMFLLLTLNRLMLAGNEVAGLNTF